ncbi:MAG: mannan endo-1,4-beta-mannosidase [Cyclobacteriaceae bacterium]|jgi:mannan endo-1,4-beta-mannosidase
MKIKPLLFAVLLAGVLSAVTACQQDDEAELTVPPIPEVLTGPYQIEGVNILNNNQAVTFKGVNALQTYGLVNPTLMNDWNIQIVREFIGNLREQPIDGFAIQASDAVWYHPLQNIVDQNRANNKITILCPFGWVNDEGIRTLFTGLNPSSQDFYEAYKLKMALIAQHFKDQPDVWIEVWNEPYHWNNENDYSHNVWLQDMKDMVDNLRWVAGFQNIIVVPGNEQGQSEEAVMMLGNELLEDRYNLVFDLHAYEKWLVNTNEEELITRIERIKNAGFALIMGEVGVQNVGDVMPVQDFLNAAKSTDLSVLAWLWDRNSAYRNALLTEEGLPHATADNNFWGTAYKSFLTE